MGCGQGAELDDGLDRVVWATAIQGPQTDEIRALAIVPICNPTGAVVDSDIVVAGTYADELRVGAATVAATIAGSSASELFVARLTSGGEVRRLRTIGQPSGRVQILRATGGASAWLAGTFFGAALSWPGAELPGTESADGFAVRLADDGTARAAATIGGEGQQVVSAVTSDLDGGAWLGGRFEGRLAAPIGGTATSSGSTDAFIVRLDAQGAVDGGQTFGGISPESVTAMSRTQAGTVVVAVRANGPIVWPDGQRTAPRFETSAVVAAFDPDGALVWLTSFEAAEIEILSIAGTGDGVVVAGVMRGDVSVDGQVLLSWISGLDVFVVELDRLGAVTNARRFGGQELDLVRAVGVDRTGAVWMTGTFQSDLRFGGTTLVAEGSRDFYVARLAPDLSPRWALRFGGPGGDQVAAGLAIADDGTAVVAAGFEAEIDVGAEPTSSRGGLDGLIMKLRP